MNPERLAFGKKKRNKSRLPKTRYLSTTRQDMKKNALLENEKNDSLLKNQRRKTEFLLDVVEYVTQLHENS